MKKLKKWIIETYLPAWAKEELLGEVQRLRAENEQLRSQIREKNIYISGLRTGVKSQRRIAIYTGEGKS